MSKVLIAYFSAGGVTEKAAKQLAEACDADLFEIRPEVPYSAADLDWRDRQSRSTLEMADPDCRPAVTGWIENMDEYDTVFVGFPIWWYREPSIVDTFLEQYDLKGKRIVPFCTSGGSGIEKAAERIRGLLGQDVCINEGKRLAGSVSKEDLKTWTEGLGL